MLGQEFTGALSRENLRGKFLLPTAKLSSKKCNSQGLTSPSYCSSDIAPRLPLFNSRPLQLVTFTLVRRSLKQSHDPSGWCKYIKLKCQGTKLETLAERERRVIALAAEGVSNKAIATRLGTSIITLEKNQRIAYSKLSVASTAEMATMATFGRFFTSYAKQEV